MKIFTIVAFATCISLTTANCGCLKCSEHLTVIGKTIPIAGSRAVVISRAPNICQHHTLTYKMQTPDATIETTKAVPELKYKIVAAAPCDKAANPFATKILGPITVKLQTPAPFTAGTTTTTNLKPIIDRIVIPSPSGCDLGIKEYTKPISDSAPYVEHAHNIYREPTVFVNPIRSCFTPNVIVDRGIRNYLFNKPFVAANLGRRAINEIITTYDALSNPESDLKSLKSRSKRELPFVRHGYKFVMNMLPEFIQEPIKHTVNTLALTHPDKRLQKVYSQPRKLSLKEKLEMNHKRNIALLKRKLRNRHYRNNFARKPHFNDIPVTRSIYDSSTNPWSRQFSSRTNLMYKDTEADPFLDKKYLEVYANDLKGSNELDESVYSKSRSEESPLKKKLKKRYETQQRSKRSLYERKWDKYKKIKGLKRYPITSELVLPFYQIEEDSLEDRQSYRTNYPWRDVSLEEPEKFRYRRGGDTYNFLNPFSFRDVAVENHISKEDLLRNVIRHEIARYRAQNKQEADTILESRSKPPSSPLLQLVTFPMQLLKKLNDITGQAFPESGSLPKMIVNTKKYFRDFGRNFRKNFLHLTSDLIGDFENHDLGNNIFTDILYPARHRRNTGVRSKRYVLQMVDEEELETYLMEKLSDIFQEPEISTDDYPYFPRETLMEAEENEKKLVLKQLKPKIIIDNNGKSFLEVNGYKRPLFKTPKKKNKIMKPKRKKLNLKRYDSSEEVDSVKISALIDHAKDYLVSNPSPMYSEMPLKTIKERISHLLYETDMLVHLDFEKYDAVYDSLLVLQHMKTSVVQDWKRLIISKTINDIEAKVALLEKFKELQYYKDIAFSNVVSILAEDTENIFIVKKLIKILVRLQKLQCIINQVVSIFHDHLHISSQAEISREIRYADFLSGLNFANEKTRNAMLANLGREKDAALQRNIILLNKLKKLLHETSNEKIEKEASLLWEMRNIEKMQRSTIEDMEQLLRRGYKVKKELKILFDLLKRYEKCEANQKKLLSNFNQASSEEVSKPLKKKQVNKKMKVEELKQKWQDRLRKRKTLLRKKLRKNHNKQSEEYIEDD